MKSKFLLLFAALAFATLHHFCVAQAESQTVKALSEKEQNDFLSRRVGAGMMHGSSFNSFCSYLFAVHNVAIHTESSEINATRFGAPAAIPDYYKPTWRELFDIIAIQTKSAWSYDSSRNYWVFAKSQKPRVYYEIETAKDWTKSDSGGYVGYHPAIAPVGMDIHILGTYSSDDPNAAGELYKKLKEYFAVNFARPFKEDVALKNMKNVKIGNYQALYFEIKVPSRIIWRQWAIVDEGRAFVIVSAIKPEHDKKLYPDVQKMISTFKVLK